MKKRDEFTGVIENYDFPNKGSLCIDGTKVTVKGALPGQKIRAVVNKKKAGMCEARLLEVIEKSPLEDATTNCPYYGLCGGCTYRSMSYENQLELKEGMVKKLLAPFVDGLANANCNDENGTAWEGIVGSPVTTGYRNKMEFTFGDSEKGGPLTLGLHKKNSFYDILTIAEEDKGCEIISEAMQRVLYVTERFFRDKKVPHYNKMKHTGILRNLVVRESFATGEIMVNLVATSDWSSYGFDRTVILEEYKMALLAIENESSFIGTISGILYSQNDNVADVVQADELILLYGKEYITEEVLGLQFKISPFSFFQTNTMGCEVLYEKAREFIMSTDTMDGSDAEPTKVVFDLYSGTGTIGQLLAPVSKKVIGIEIVEEAVAAANENAKLNGIENATFIAGDVLKALDLVEDKPDLLVLDPPRDGINPRTLEKLIAFNVDEMIYISCKPTSLARDLVRLTEAGYKIKRACAVDQFPGTQHVETVVLMSKVK